MGIIGIILIAFNILLFIPLPIPPIPFVFWMLSYGLFQIFPDAIIVYSLFLSTVTVGLVSYIIGRRRFSNSVRRSKIASGLLTFSGLILTISSFLFLVLVVLFVGSDFAGPRTSREWVMYSLLLVWGVLGSLSGVLWLVDGVRLGEVEAPPIKKEIDLESQTKYPRNLLAKYMKKYPHNPTGVLEWHIDKKMKEGRTREQAIDELTKENG